MKMSTLAVVLSALAAGGPAVAVAADAHDHDADRVARHGGMVAEARHLVYELVAAPEGLRLYLRDHGKPVAVAGGQARLTVLTGKEKQAVVLQPAGDRFEGGAGMTLAAGAKLVAVVQLADSPPATVRFVVR